MDGLSDLMEAPDAVVEMTVGAAIGHGLLVLLGLFACLVAGIVAARGSGDLVGTALVALLGVSILIPAENRFFRAVSATDTRGNWIAIIVFCALAIGVGWLASRISGRAAAWAGGAAFVSLAIARALDAGSEFLAGIPLGWLPAIGVVLVGFGLLTGKIKL